MATTAQIFHISIAVYRGEPLDYQRYRHTALCFRPAAASAAGADAPPSPPLSSVSAPTSSPPPQQAHIFSPAADSKSLTEGPAILLHTVANHGDHWELSVIASVNPRELPNKVFAKEVSVGMLSKPLSKAQLVSTVSQTAVDNDDPEFNCQVWVEAVLTKLMAAGLLSEDDYRNGFDAMVDATMEATDEIAM